MHLLVLHGRQRRAPLLAGSILAASIFPISIIASAARLASARPAANASVSARGVIYKVDAPSVLAPAASARTSAMAANDGPIADGPVLIFRRHLEAARCRWLEGSVVLEVHTRNAIDGAISRRTHASKIFLAHLLERLRERRFTLPDKQFTVEHLKM